MNGNPIFTEREKETDKGEETKKTKQRDEEKKKHNGEKQRNEMANCKLNDNSILTEKD